MNAAAYAWKVAAAWLAVIIGISTNTEDIYALSRRGRTTWQRYGAPFVLVLRGALESYYQIEHVLDTDNDGLNSYQESLLMECNMVAVAAAIVSSVTITTFQFPSIMEMHWTVSAAFTFSLVASLFCVYGACTLQRRISNLPNAVQFRLWLSAAPMPGSPDSISDGFINSMHDEPQHQRANVATVLTLTAPKTLLDHSIRFFLAGLVGYLVCIHSLSVQSGGLVGGSDDGQTLIMLAPSYASSPGSRNTIIVCAFSLCIGISLLISPSSYKNFVTTLSSPTRTHAHGNAGIVEGPKWQGDSHYSRPTASSGRTEGASEKTYLSNVTTASPGAANIVDSLRSNGSGPGSYQQSEISVSLVNALGEAAAAHERSAVAARECAKADEKVAELYARLIVSRGS